MMFNYDSFAKLRIFRNKAIASRLNIVNVCLGWGDLWVKAPDSRKHENMWINVIFIQINNL